MQDFMNWDDELKNGLKQVALAHMDAFQVRLSLSARLDSKLGADFLASSLPAQNWFYWT